MLEVEGSFPTTDAATSERMRTALAQLPEGTVVLADGLAFSAVPEVVREHVGRLRFAVIVHMPLADAAGLDAHTRRELEQRERRALQAASVVIATGQSTRQTLLSYGVPTDRVLVIEPGTEPAPVAQGSGEKRLRLLCVAALTPGKGHRLLIDALADTPLREWHLTCAGSLSRDPVTAAQVREQVGFRRLQEFVTLAGELEADAMQQAYARADLFVLATFRETFGMAVAEALARGLPVISTAAGKIPSLVGSDAGLIVPPGDQPALTNALTRVMSDSALRERLAAGARRVRERLPSWDGAFDKMAAALESIYG